MKQFYRLDRDCQIKVFRNYGLLILNIFDKNVDLNNKIKKKLLVLNQKASSFEIQ